ncbi:MULTISPECIES: chlorite dismutase family protein [Acinetobacter]|uniref:chlorite dismutase family protein n=1 Tax=Acinetobacter TaxID=469 RepID=UPI0015B77950|nr:MULTISPECIES: chlorite dismutase family protein [Acinetobacter]MBT0888573.1 chlorite dismutase family protein [Acinetobacter towneri]NWJ93977.1 chlorite dismutase family protein [Acinetobacter sp. Swhac1]
MKNHYSFVGGSAGNWIVTKQDTIVGSPLELVQRIEVVNSPAANFASRGAWVLQGFTSNVRYTNRNEIVKLQSVQEGLNRNSSLCAALIPIKKNAVWWSMSQDERRSIFEEQSHHTEIGLNYLPEIARQLHHSRDLGEQFDFITWFEFAPEHKELFNKLLKQLRSTKEWQFVDREIDIRLEKNA